MNNNRALGSRLWIPETPYLSRTTKEALALPNIDPSGPEMDGLLQVLRQLLTGVLETNQSIHLFPASVTHAREALTANLVAQSVLHFVTGSDSQNWYDSSLSLGKDALRVRIPDGKAITPDGIRAILDQKPDISAIALSHVEASTCAMNPIRELAPVIRSCTPNALILADATYSATSTELSFDRDHLDGLVIGSVAFGLPPGLSILVLSNRAGERLEQEHARPLGLDLRPYIGKLQPHPHTLPQALLFALGSSLRQIQQEGLAERISRHWRLAARARAFAKEHLEWPNVDGYAAYSMSAFKTPEEFDLVSLHQRLRKRGVVLGRGLGQSFQRIFRISHTHLTSLEELESLLDILEQEILLQNPKSS